MTRLTPVCPRCGYERTGIVTLRCPECGTDKPPRVARPSVLKMTWLETAIIAAFPALMIVWYFGVDVTIRGEIPPDPGRTFSDASPDEIDAALRASPGGFADGDLGVVGISITDAGFYLHIAQSSVEYPDVDPSNVAWQLIYGGQPLIRIDDASGNPVAFRDQTQAVRVHLESLRYTGCYSRMPSRTGWSNGFVGDSCVEWVSIPYRTDTALAPGVYAVTMLGDAGPGMPEGRTFRVEAERMPARR